MVRSDRLAQREFWKIAWPASVEGLLIVLLSATNLLMVSSLGKVATSAVGIFAQPKMVFLFVSRSFAVAVTAVIARKYGEGKKDQLSACLKQSFVMIAVLSGLLLFLSLAFLEPILRAAGARNDYIELALLYGGPSTVSLFFTSLSVLLHAGLLGVGQVRIMMVSNVLGNVVNLILNALLIYGIGPFPALGVLGAAYGSLMGAVATFVLTLFVVLNKDALVGLWGRADWRVTRDNASALWQVFVGAFAEQGAERIGMFLYSRIIAELGTVSFAVHTVCMSLCDMYYSFAQGMGKASLMLAGRTLGEDDEEAFFRVARAGQRIGFYISCTAVAVYVLFRVPLVAAYNSEPDVVALGARIMVFVAVVSLPEAHALICSGTLRGAGYTRYVAIYSLVSIAIVRPIVTWVLCFVFNTGLYGAWAALLLDQTMRAVCAAMGLARLKKRGTRNGGAAIEGKARVKGAAQ